MNDDCASARLPSALMRGLAALFARTLKTGAAEAESAIVRLFGPETAPTFSQVTSLSEADLRETASRIEGVPISKIAELAGLLPHFGPDIPACPSCGEVALRMAGGKAAKFDADVICPFCGQSKVAVVPIKLRRLAWTDLSIVDRDITHDVASVPGERYPLYGRQIEEWAGRISPAIKSALSETGVPLYAFLAYLRRGLRNPEEAAELLADPQRFGFDGEESLRRAAQEAKIFAEEREPTNLRPRLPVMRRRGLDYPDLVGIEAAGRRYLIEFECGRGEHSMAYRGFWDHSPTELVIVKIGESRLDADSFERERAVLNELAASEEPGAHHFTGMLPQLVSVGEAADASGAIKPASVIRYRNQFDWTLADVMDEYPEGVEPAAMAWMWNRTLMLLSWVHSNRIAHCAVRPEHVLINPVTHGGTLIGWSEAARFGARLRPEGLLAFHPEGLKASPEADIAASARTMIAVCGGHPNTGEMPQAVPDPIADFLRREARYRGGPAAKGLGAYQLHAAFGETIRTVFGKRKFVPFIMPRKNRN